MKRNSPARQRTAPSRRSGFTLIELLVVIAIGCIICKCFLIGECRLLQSCSEIWNHHEPVVFFFFGIVLAGAATFKRASKFVVIEREDF
jgi:prepilin-type N-terminal cleavage/methylation domain-containing protein